MLNCKKPITKLDFVCILFTDKIGKFHFRVRYMYPLFSNVKLVLYTCKFHAFELFVFKIVLSFEIHIIIYLFISFFIIVCIHFSSLGVLVYSANSSKCYQLLVLKIDNYYLPTFSDRNSVPICFLEKQTCF